MFKSFLRWWRQRDFHRLQKKKVEDIFSEVYSANTWGGKPGEFYSGDGTHNPDVLRYTTRVKEFIREKNIRTIVEIGCGDFHVSRQIITGENVNYIGTDVVAALIEHHQKTFSSEGVSFQKVNAIEGTLPAADLVIIRQVLQHLNNDQIAGILGKLSGYRYALITEHVPATANPDYNVDKIAGPHIRMKFNSGVFIDKPPFNLQNTSVLLEYRHDDHIQGKTIPAMIRTYVVETKA